MGAIRLHYAGIGIDADGGVDLTLQCGATPSTCQITMKGNTLLAAVPLSGDLVITDGIATVTLPMYADKIEEVKTRDGGRRVQVTLKDVRYKWKYGNLCCKWNQPDKAGKPPDITTPPADKRSAYDLFQDIKTAAAPAMLGLDISAAPTNKWPAVDWALIPPSQALQELCELVGLTVAPHSDGTFALAAVGTGAALPVADYVERETDGAGTDELPSQIIIRGSKIVLEETLTDWTLVGKETVAKGSKILPIDQLSYKPSSGTIAQWAAWMKGKWKDITVDATRKLAQECVFKWYSWEPASNRKARLPWLDMRAEPKKVYETGVGEVEQRVDPVVRADYFDEEHQSPKVTDWTQVDITDGWSVDREKGIIKFSKPMFKRTSVASAFGWDPAAVDKADVRLTIAYELNNNDESDYYLYYWLPGWTPNCGVAVEQMEELVLYGSVSGGILTYKNKTELDAYCASLKSLIERKYSSGVAGESKTYRGIIAQDCDGAITSVEWSANAGSGATTKVQRGRDKPPITLPSYKEYQYRMKQGTVQRQADAVTTDLGRKVAETRSGSITRDGTSKASDIPMRARGELLVKNADGTTAPLGGMAEVTGYEASTGAALITRPTGDNKQNVVVVHGAAIPAGEYGIATEHGTDYVQWTGTGTTPVAGDRIGSKNGQWQGEKNGGGTHVVRMMSGSDALAAKEGGPSGIHFCRIVSNVLKKLNPKDGTLTDFEKDMDEVYEGVTQQTLDHCDYPDLTFLVVYSDSSGEYFAHPFAQWRPYVAP